MLLLLLLLLVMMMMMTTTNSCYRPKYVLLGNDRLSNMPQDVYRTDSQS